MGSNQGPRIRGMDAKSASEFMKQIDHEMLPGRSLGGGEEPNRKKPGTKPATAHQVQPTTPMEKASDALSKIIGQFAEVQKTVMSLEMHEEWGCVNEH